MISKEMQKTVKAYNDGYRVDLSGSIIRIDNSGVVVNHMQGNIKKFKNYSLRYLTIKFEKKSTRTPVHRLQAYQKFGDKLFEPGIQVRHLNGDSLDNSWDNIEIGTASQNQMDKPKEMRVALAKAVAKSVRLFTDEQVCKLREDYKEGFTYVELMHKYNVKSKSTISDIINYKIYKDASVA